MTFIRAGLQTSVQDFGRPGYMHQGISHSGAMDSLAMRLANWLVGNKPRSAVIEVALVGPDIEFHRAMTIAASGADFELSLNGQPCYLNRSIRVVRGDRLTFGKLRRGCRAYLACSAELELHRYFGSVATHITAGFGGFSGRALRDGDRLETGTVHPEVNRELPTLFQLIYTGHYLLRCVPCVETHLFNQQQQQFFQNQRWQVSAQSNRMGVRLAGQALQHQQEDIRSSGLLPGSIQIPPSGLPVIAAVDGQTIGGYPRIASVIRADLPLLGQLKAGDTLSFNLVDIEQARGLYEKQQALLRQLEEIA